MLFRIVEKKIDVYNEDCGGSTSGYWKQLPKNSTPARGVAILDT